MDFRTRTLGGLRQQVCELAGRLENERYYRGVADTQLARKLDGLRDLVLRLDQDLVKHRRATRHGTR